MFTSRIIYKVCFVLLLPFILWWCFYMPASSHPSNIPLFVNISSYIFPEKNTSLILPETQCNGTVFLVVVVCSAVPNFKERNTVRNTWMKYTSIKRSIQVYFLLGKSLNASNDIDVKLESDKYSDIIQENFLDTYYNLTLKSIMLLKWVKQNCGNAKYLMKTDDDVFVHLPNLFNLLEGNRHNKVLLGFRIKDGIVFRDKNSKHYVPDYMFREKTYPPYLSGTGYVISVNIVNDLFQAAQETDFIHMEDVFITGLCARKIGLHPTQQDNFLSNPQGALPKTCCAFNALITVHKLLPEKMLNVWQKCYQNISSYPTAFPTYPTTSCPTTLWT